MEESDNCELTACRYVRLAALARWCTISRRDCQKGRQMQIWKEIGRAFFFYLKNRNFFFNVVSFLIQCSLFHMMLLFGP